MSKLLAFGFNSVNQYGQANIGSYTQAHPLVTFVIGIGMVFALLLIAKLFMK